MICKALKTCFLISFFLTVGKDRVDGQASLIKPFCNDLRGAFIIDILLYVTYGKQLICVTLLLL